LRNKLRPLEQQEQQQDSDSVYSLAITVRQRLSVTRKRYERPWRQFTQSVVEYIAYLSPLLAGVAMLTLLFGTSYSGSFANHPTLAFWTVTIPMSIAIFRYGKHLWHEKGSAHLLRIALHLAPPLIFILCIVLPLAFFGSDISPALVDPIFILWILSPPFVAYILDNLFLNTIYVDLCTIYKENIELFEGDELLKLAEQVDRRYTATPAP
jgi:hypothetical protein